jgi:uncharacterized protein with ParB-like and HNH nuclease domain
VKTLNIPNTISIKSLLQDTDRLVIPWYQRAYSWGKGSIEDFFEDLSGSMLDKRQHFLGSIMTILVPGEKEKNVVDGQQRLTTVAILLKAYSNYLKDIPRIKGQEETPWDLEDEDCLSMHTSITETIFKKARKGKAKASKIKTSKKNSGMFETIIGSVNSKEIREYHKACNESSDLYLQTNKDMYQSYQKCCAYIDEKAKHLHDNLPELRSHLYEEVDHLLYNFMVLEITVPDVDTAYRFFLSLNNRGKDLSKSDILKAHFFDLARGCSDEQEHISNAWDEFENSLGNYNPDDFLRHYWLSKFEQITTSEVLKNIQDKCKTFGDAFELLKDVKDEAKRYSDLRDKQGSSKKESNALESVMTLAENFVMPPLMAGKNSLEKDDFLTLLKLIETFVFRFRTICHKENKNMERVFSQIAISLRAGYALSEVKKDLLVLDPGDNSFKTLFSEEATSEKVAKYVLRKIESHSRETKNKKYLEWDAEVQLEHIMPKKPNDWWKSLIEEQSLEHRIYHRRLGNLTLLTAGSNNQLKNSAYTIKRESYINKSVYILNDYFRKCESWGKEEIEARQEYLSESVNDIWNLEDIET